MIRGLASRLARVVVSASVTGVVLLSSSPSGLATPAHAHDASPSVLPAAPVQAGPANDQTTVTLIDQPAWVAPDGAVSVTVKISRPPDGGQLETTLYDKVPDRNSLRRSLFGLFGKAITPNGLDTQALDKLPRGSDGSVTATVSFSLSPTDSKPPKVIWVPTAGVYPLDLQVSDRGGKRVTQFVTWIIRLPELSDGGPNGRTPLNVALVLPLRARPSHQPDGTVKVPADVRDRVQRLTQALSGADGGPLTLLPTPELLDSLAASDDPRDAQLLTRLRLLAGIPGHGVLPGPYVDLDLPAWLRQPSLRDRSAVEWARGAQALQTQLGVAPLAAMAVSPSDLTNDAVRWLHDQGVRQTLVVPQALADHADPPTRPFSLSSGTGVSVQAVAVNDLSEVGFALQDGRRGVQEILAALAQTALSAPAGPQETVLAPSLDADSWSADPQRLTELLQALSQPAPGGAAPLIQLIPLTEAFRLPVATTTPSSSVPLVLRAADVDPPSLTDFDQSFADAQQQLASFREMLVTTAGTPPSSNAGLVRATAFDQLLGIAGSQELTAQQQNQFIDGLVAALHRELASVAAPARQTVTLTSRSGSIPLTLHNSLGYAVQVQIHMESSERLAFPGGTAQVLTLNGENTPIEIPVRTRTSGDAPLTITVTSPDGRLVLATTNYTVRSTAVSGVGLALTIGAAVVLLAWWVRSLHRGRRARASTGSRSP